MPLSEYEQRVLEEMEQRLRSDDPKLAKAISGGAPRRPLQVVLGGLVALGGIGLLFVALTTQMIWLGVIAFVAMFAGVLVALQRAAGGADMRGGADPRGGGDSNVRPLKRRSGSFMDKLEQRWDRRREGDR